MSDIGTFNVKISKYWCCFGTILVGGGWGVVNMWYAELQLWLSLVMNKILWVAWYSFMCPYIHCEDIMRINCCLELGSFGCLPLSASRNCKWGKVKNKTFTPVLHKMKFNNNFKTRSFCTGKLSYSVNPIRPHYEEQTHSLAPWTTFILNGSARVCIAFLEKLSPFFL